jgi:hypothetical protein
MGMSVVIVGNLSEGFRVAGPFKTRDEAGGWCNDKNFGLNEAWVMELEDPKTINWSA